MNEFFPLQRSAAGMTVIAAVCALIIGLSFALAMFFAVWGP